MSSNPNINLTLGKKVKKLRTEKKLTREALAEMLNVSSRFLADVEAGKVGISLVTLKKLSLILETTSDYLLDISSYSDEKLRFIALDNKINQVPEKAIPYLKEIIDAFLGALEK